MLLCCVLFNRLKSTHQKIILSQLFCYLNRCMGVCWWRFCFGLFSNEMGLYSSVIWRLSWDFYLYWQQLKRKYSFKTCVDFINIYISIWYLCACVYAMIGVVVVVGGGIIIIFNVCFISNSFRLVGIETFATFLLVHALFIDTDKVLHGEVKCLLFYTLKFFCSAFWCWLPIATADAFFSLHLLVKLLNTLAKISFSVYVCHLDRQESSALCRSDSIFFLFWCTACIPAPD